MNDFMKYLGVVILLVGVLVLAIPALTNTSSNGTLWTGLILIIAGFFTHIFINRKIEK
ncbi:hypothetical protein [Porphyromonas pogonae]|uniref:hypothetical protein n=1 Tax=Porphyromonas pogonae TaxID=867595 RepID=UPI002E763FE8|nr:hypothetical protein [Porphyromonas pogonae]